MFILQMAGFPGSGKSTLAKEISKYMDVVIIDRDIIKSSMIESGVNKEIVSNSSYHVTFALCKYYLSINKNVIIDTPCFYNGTLENGIKIANDYKAKYKYIECIVEDFNVINNRLMSREKFVSQIEYAQEENFILAKNKSKRPANHEYLTIDSSLPIDMYIQDVLTYLNK